MDSRCAIQRPSLSFASLTTLSKPSGRNATSKPCLARPLAAPASDMVITSAPGRPAATLLLQAAQHRLPAGAQELHLDAGVMLELVGKLLSERDRRRGVPAQRAFLARRRLVGPIGSEGLRPSWRRDSKAKAKADGEISHAGKAPHRTPPRRPSRNVSYQQEHRPPGTAKTQCAEGSRSRANRAHSNQIIPPAAEPGR